MIRGKIFELNSSRKHEVELVAQRMRETLIEVLGIEKGGAMYSMDWLRDRVLWHLNPHECLGKVFVFKNDQEDILGHAICRVERAKNGGQMGFFSTLYVVPEARNKGVASKLVKTVHHWFTTNRLSRSVYNTAKTNDPLLNLFGKFGYRIMSKHQDMVQLAKDFHPR